MCRSIKFALKWAGYSFIDWRVRTFFPIKLRSNQMKFIWMKAATLVAKWTQNLPNLTVNFDEAEMTGLELWEGNPLAGFFVSKGEKSSHFWRQFNWHLHVRVTWSQCQVIVVARFLSIRNKRRRNANTKISMRKKMKRPFSWEKSCRLGQPPTLIFGRPFSAQRRHRSLWANVSHTTSVSSGE